MFLVERGETDFLNNLLTSGAEGEVKEGLGFASGVAVGVIESGTGDRVGMAANRGDRGFDAIDSDSLDAGGIQVGHADIADAIRVLANFGSDFLIAGHLLGAASVILAAHGHLLEVGEGTRGGVTGVDGDRAGFTADCAPIGDFTGEDAFDLRLGQSLDGIRAVHNDRDSVVSHDGGLERAAIGGGGGEFGIERAAAGHADIGGAVDDGGDAGGGTFSGDAEADARVRGLVGFGELRDEFCAESVGAFDDEFGVRMDRADRKDCRDGEGEEFFHFKGIR